MIPNFGPMEVAIVLGLALIVFGPRRLPDLGRSLGKGISGFRKEIDQVGDISEPVAKTDTPQPDGEADMRQPA